MVEDVKRSLLQLTDDYELLSGDHERTVDEKGRVVLPAGQWRDTFAGRAWIGPYKGQSLAMFTARSFARLLEKVADQEAARMVPDGSIENLRRANPMIPIDSQGRFTIPPHLREIRAIEGGSMVYMEGQGDRLEIRTLERAKRLSPAEYDSFIELLDHR
jgi:DNA-binding transcriptional regulator/RsmH inhibitor MraZ